MSAKTKLRNALRAIDDARRRVKRAKETMTDDSDLRRALRELDDAYSEVERAIREIPD